MLLAFLFACSPTAPDSAADSADSVPLDDSAAPLSYRLDQGVLEAFADGGAHEVIVRLAEPTLNRPDLFAALHDAVWSDLEGAGVFAEHRYAGFPVAVVDVDDETALARLAGDPRVAWIEMDTPHEHALAESLPMIGQGNAAAQGYTGSGTTVAVLDTGADYTRSAFGSCSAPGGTCKVAYAQDFATADNSRDDNGHGTNVSAIVLGVAPGARVAALDVFRSDGYAYTSDILSAIDWVVTNRSTYNIQSMNMSLGSGSYSSTCSTDSFASAIANARSAGVLSAIASGNNGYTSSISSPACVPGAVSVGAVYDANVGGLRWSNCTDNSTAADQVTCFSNTASMLQMLAPGALITAADLTMGGTSQASPHVAGGIAVLRAAFPDDTPDETVARLRNGGTSVRDARTGVSFPRLNLPGSLALTNIDASAPTGTVSINGGAAATNSTSTTLTLSATDDTSVSQMCISNSSSCTSWVAYATSKAWTTSSGTGTRTVYAWFKDAAGNVSAAASDTILGDTTAPTNGTLAASAGNGSVALSWSGFSDSGAGVASYKVVYGTSAPSSCSSGTTLYTGSATSASASGLTNGTAYSFRACAIDGAGNTSTGATATSTPASEFTAPTGTVVINAGAATTTSTSSTLTLSASDASGVSAMCISNTSSCTSWVGYTTSKSWTLSGSGTVTVYAWFRDTNGNVSSPVSDTIVLDKTAPSNGTVTATPSSGQVALSWSGFSDSGTGIASYKVVYGTSSPSSCSAGTTVYTGTSTSYTHTGLTNGTTYTWRVCALDVAGNTSGGSTVSSRPAPEFDAPTGGSVVINGGAAYTGSATVTLTLAASDASGVSQVCLSNSSSCSSWVSWATSKSWAISSSSGTRTVYAWFKDTYGNTTTAAVSDAIVMDATKPSNGTLTGSAAGSDVTLTWSGSTDSGAGIASYKLVTHTSSPSSGCTNGTVIYQGTESRYVQSAVATGTKYYRLCAVDAVGNIATGATATVTVN